MKKVVIIVFLCIFVLTAILTLSGIANWIDIKPGYLDKLFYALIIEVISGVIVFFKDAISSKTLNVKVYLTAKPINFDRKEIYKGEYVVKNVNTGESKIFTAEPYWHAEAGYLTVQVKDVGENDYLDIKITDSNNKIWKSGYFHSLSPKAELNQA
jgi:hypothetical protein